ncbi:MAG TPA: MFS transporter, partial [Flavobacterium sp.]|nr:MFS transporter [Flavobacterium sp.]
FWALFVTLAAEQFGTNLRSTATTSVPNMVRGSVPVMLIGFDYLKTTKSVINSAAIVGAVAFGLAIYAALTISETHHRNLDFVE